MLRRGMMAGVSGGGGGGSDPHWASVVALLHLDGVNGATTVTDETGRSWTVGSDATISTATSKFGGASLATGTTGYLSAATGSAFAFGSGDFTIEAFINTASLTYQNIFNNRNAGGDSGVCFRVKNDGRLEAFHGPGTAQMNAPSVNLTTLTFPHVALCRAGSTWGLFVNGNLEVSTGVTGDITSSASATSFIGCYGAAGTTTERFVGNIDEVRITTGVARYTANFTPPVAPFPNS